MGVITKSCEFTVRCPFKNVQVHGDTKINLIPTLLPEKIKSIEFIGDGGDVTIRTTYFADGSPVKYVKHKMDEIDETNNNCKFTVIEHDFRDENLERMVHDFRPRQMESPFTSCPTLAPKDEDMKAGEEQDKAIQVALVKYLMANPDLYA